MRLTLAAIVYGMVAFANVLWISTRWIAGILNDWDIIFGLLGVLWVMATVMEVVSEEVQHPIVAAVSLFKLWAISITLFHELDLTGFGTYMPIRLPPSFYAYYGLLVIASYTAYRKGTRLSLNNKILTKLTVAISLILWTLHIFLVTVIPILHGYQPPLWIPIFGGILSIIAIWLIITTKPLFSKLKAIT
ncbi:MAG: hypothetical protein ABDH32_01775 [Candidatus Caldarchaeales archaeon]